MQQASMEPLIGNVGGVMTCAAANVQGSAQTAQQHKRLMPDVLHA
jgi:hypothetical protein